MVWCIFTQVPFVSFMLHVGARGLGQEVVSCRNCVPHNQVLGPTFFIFRWGQILNFQRIFPTGKSLKIYFWNLLQFPTVGISHTFCDPIPLFMIRLHSRGVAAMLACIHSHQRVCQQPPLSMHEQPVPK